MSGVRLPVAIIAASLQLLASAATLAQDCTDYGIAQPPVVGNLAPPPNVEMVGVAVDGDYAYISEQWGDPGLGGYPQFSVADVSDPSSPTLLGTVDLWTSGGASSDLAAWQQHAYVVHLPFMRFIRIIDATNPDQLRPGSSLAGRDVAVRPETSPGANDARLCAGEGFGQGFRLYDLADPASPLLIGPVAVGADRVSVAGDHAYATDLIGSQAVVQVIDISGPGAPTLVDTVAVPGSASDVSAQAIHGNLLYVATSHWSFDGLHVFDLSNPAAPTYAGAIETFSWVRAVTGSGDLVYASAGGGTAIIDSSGPGTPQLVGLFHPGGSDLFAAGDRLYATRGWYGLDIVDITSPEVVPLIGSLHASVSRGVAVSGQTAFLARIDLCSVDVTDPTAPAILGEVASGPAEDLVLASDLAFLASGNTGLEVVDVSDPTMMEVVGSAPGSGQGVAIDLAGAIACVASDGDGLDLFDISDPTAPAKISNIPVVQRAIDVAASGSHAYVADMYAGLHVVDLSPPPTIVSTVPIDAGAVTVADEIAYVGGRDELVTIDVSHPNSPAVLGRVAIPSGPVDIAIAGPFAYLAGGWSVTVINVNDPRSPVLVGSTPIPSSARGIAVENELVYVTGDLFIYPVQCPVTTGVSNLAASPRSPFVRVFPNPARTSVIIELEDASGPAKLGIYDGSGRLVRALSGYHLLSWDGRDEGGQRVPSGVYWLRFDGGDAGVQTRSITVLR